MRQRGRSYCEYGTVGHRGGEDLIMKYGIFDAGYVKHLKQIYDREDFCLMGAYESDYLMIVMTVTMLCKRFSLSV